MIVLPPRDDDTGLRADGQSRRLRSGSPSRLAQCSALPRCF